MHVLGNTETIAQLLLAVKHSKEQCAEIGIVCNELLRHDSMHLHRAMAVLFENMVLSLLYMSTAVPHCT